jgi:hypothetical protein
MILKTLLRTLLVFVLIMPVYFTVGTRTSLAYDVQIVDNFESISINTDIWSDASNGGSVYIDNGRLTAQTMNTPDYTTAAVRTFPIYGDFDAQVDYMIGEGWHTPTKGHLDGASLGLAFSPEYNDWSHITRLSEVGPGDFMLVYCSKEDEITEPKHSPVYENDELTSGSYRIVRNGPVFSYYFKNPGDNEWQLLCTHDTSTCHPDLGPVEIYLSNGSIDAAQSFITYFDNFQLSFEPNTVNVDYWTSYRYYLDGDTYDNSPLDGFKHWYSEIGNVDDSSNQPVHNTTSRLDSVYSLSGQISDTAFSAPPSPYNWNFGDVPEHITRGIWLGTSGEDPPVEVTFSQGFNATRTTSKSVFYEDGDQTVTVGVTPLEKMDQLWIRYVVDDNPLVSPSIISYSAGSEFVIDQINDHNLWTTINNPEINHEYILPVTIHLDLAEESGSVEYMPQIHITNCDWGEVSTYNSHSITYDPDGLGNWTWVGDSYYSWDQYISFFRTLHMQERINSADPNIDIVTPDRANRGDVLDVNLSGSCFTDVDSVSFGDGINVTGFNILDSNSINASIQIDTPALSGPRDITLTVQGKQYVFPDAFLINTDGASIEFVSARNFGVDGDDFNNESVNGFKFWASNMGNTNDGSGSTMYNLTSTLDSQYDFLWQEPNAQMHEDNIYKWSFGNVPENGAYGMAVGGDWENTIFVDYYPGFTASRSITPRILQQDGQQVFTLDVMAKETMDYLRVLISVNPNTMITPIIIETDAISVPEQTDSYPGPNRWDIYLHHPQVDTLYTFKAVISADIADEIGAVEYVPQVDIVCVNSTNHSQQSSSVTCNTDQLDGLGSWTWSADGDYLWNWVNTFSKGITLNEYVNVGPLVTNAAANPNPVAVNTPVGLFAKVTDSSGVTNIGSVTYSLDSGISWISMSYEGCGPTVNATADLGPFSQACVYEILVHATDSAGINGPTESILLAVYDSYAGFVTGGGWINSPQGAYTADPDLTGKATFGFVSKYQKGQTVPTGNTEFQFKTGNINFKSTSYEWLVVAGSKAQFKGIGTINGEGTYKFMLTANDNPDTFRIKITDGDNVVYDNKVDTDLGGGNIVIHK